MKNNKTYSKINYNGLNNYCKILKLFNPMIELYQEKYLEYIMDCYKSNNAKR